MAKTDKFSPEYIRKHRTFPTGKTILLALCILAQIILVFAAIFVRQPEPQDRIDTYKVTVEPQKDGSLDITYDIVWTPLDAKEPLTWVEIGVANSNFSIYQDSVKGGWAYRNVVDDYCYVRIDFPRSYKRHETVEFSFKINQRDLLYGEGKDRFYEFVPGWFNATPIEQYTFRWKADDEILASNADTHDLNWHTWQGSLECGQYVPMEVQYSVGSFADAEAISYHAFDDSGAYNDLKQTQNILRALAIIAALALIAAEVYIVDSYVSYSRGRGFMRSGGYYIHHYGRINPRYRAYRAAQSRSHSGGGGSRGCACACACACAGGGRAGCSRKQSTLGNDASLRINLPGKTSTK